MNRDEFILRQTAIILSVLSRLTADRHLIDDLCQDVLLKCWEYERRRGDLPPDGFVAEVARNQFLSWLRKRQPREWPSGFDEQSSEEDPAEAVEQTEQSLVLSAMLGALPPLYRDITRLHIVEGWTQERIARDKGLPVNTVKTQFRRAKVLLEEGVKRHFLN